MLTREEGLYHHKTGKTKLKPKTIATQVLLILYLLLLDHIIQKYMIYCIFSLTLQLNENKTTIILFRLQHLINIKSPHLGSLAPSVVAIANLPLQWKSAFDTFLSINTWDSGWIPD